MNIFLKYMAVGALLIFSLVLVFGFSVNGKLGSREIDFSINGIPRYETLTLGRDVYVIDRRTGEAKLLISGGRSQLGKPFRKMRERPEGAVPEEGEAGRMEDGKGHERTYTPF